MNEALILQALPQTQCTRCGFPDCASYAQAIAQQRAGINQCPPGGMEGIEKLAAITGLAPVPLDADCGTEGPRSVAWIDEDWCIGCTLCIKACPTDAIIGSNKQMHTVIEPYCTGCELCLPVCPVDCIHLENVSGTRTGWQAWSQEQADVARQRYQQRQQRWTRDKLSSPQHPAQSTNELPVAQAHGMAVSTATPEPDPATRKKQLLQAVLERAKSVKA